MNFKVGSNVYIEVEIGRVEDSHTQPYICVTKCGYVFRATEDELFSTFSESPAPVRWRDGAVEVPDNSRPIWWMKKHCESKNIQLVSSAEVLCVWLSWIYWLYADEFPMPLLPVPVEPEIEPCPFCGTGDEDIVCEEIGAMWEVICGNCGYQSCTEKTSGQAIEAHNDLSRKVRE